MNREHMGGETPEMTVIGLTGGSGAGKTAVAKLIVKALRGRARAEHIDCDAVSRGVMVPGSECASEVGAAFPPVVLENGEIDRRALGKIVFGDPEALTRLNVITHKYILARLAEELEALRGTADIIILDAPTLFESGADRLCDTVICVTASAGRRLKRLQLREETDEKALRSRLLAQPDDRFYISRSRRHIVNSGSLFRLSIKAAEAAAYALGLHHGKSLKGGGFRESRKNGRQD